MKYPLIQMHQRISKPGHAYQNGHVEKFRFEKDAKTQEQSHQKGWAKFDLNGTFEQDLDKDCITDRRQLF